MDALDVPLIAGALLLVVSGVAKLRRPADADRALRLTGLPSSATFVRLLGAVELAAGAGTIVVSDRAVFPAIVALLYAGFVVFVVLAVWRRAPLTSCGCFGAAGVTPTPLHAGLNAGLAAVAAVTASEPRAGPIDVVADGGVDAVILVGGAVALAGALYALFTRWRGSRSAR